jgi:hypothetical protein
MSSADTEIWRDIDVSAATAQLGLSDSAQQLAQSAQAPVDYAGALAQGGLYADAVAFLSNALQDKAAVRWAVESARLVADQLPENEVGALEAADSWANGSASVAGLQDALGETAFQGPGSWAAQAAAWAAENALPGGPGNLVPKAVEGAVKLAAAMAAGSWSPPEIEQREQLATAAASEAALADTATEVVSQALDPAELAALNEALKPFVELALEMAANQALA